MSNKRVVYDIETDGFMVETEKKRKKFQEELEKKQKEIKEIR